MGFRMERTVYDLPFEGTALEGLAIRVRAMTMDERMHVYFGLSRDDKESAEVNNKRHDDKLAMFIGHVTEWNIETEDGQPVPINLDGLYGVAEPEQVGVIIGIWAMGRMAVPAPLEQPSPSTGLSEIPMTALESTPAPA